jgi:zinc transport system substrate-binding protein
LVSAGAEAHDFEPKPSDLRAIKEADVVVYIHPAFEAWMAAAIESIEPGKVIVQAADLSEEADAPEISGGEHDHGGVDPHVWLNPEEASGMVAKIRDGLVRADSTHREAYESNAAALVAQLAELGSQIVAALRACKLETVVVSHLAYGHLLEDYNIEQIGLAGLDAEVSETGPRTISEVVNRMKAEGIEHILVEPILDSALALQVTAETGATVLPLSPLENLTSAEIAAGDDYFTVMSRNLESLQTALRCAR